MSGRRLSLSPVGEILTAGQLAPRLLQSELLETGPIIDA